MKEKELYKISEMVEEAMDDLTEGWYPSVEELDDHKVVENPEKYVAILSYFASNPFKRLGLVSAEEEDYKQTVKHCKQLLYRIAEKL